MADKLKPSRVTGLRIERLVRSLVALIGLAIASQAMALTPVAAPPMTQSVDANGVDVARGGFAITSSDFVIGAGVGAMPYVRYWQDGTGWRDNYIATISGSSTAPVVSIGGSSDTFDYNSSTAGYDAREANGATLTYSSGYYTYTTRDGTVAVYTAATGYDGYESQIGVVQSITFPNGLIWNYFYRTQMWCPTGADDNGRCYNNTVAYMLRLQSVTNNAGYQIKYNYASNTASDPYDRIWFLQIVSVVGVNNAIDYCQPNADSCSFSQTWPTATYSHPFDYAGSGTHTVTDALGNVTTYTITGGRITGIKRPGSASDNVTIAYAGPSGAVSQVINNGTTWNYSWSGTATRTMVMTGALSTQRTVTSDQWNSSDWLLRTDTNAYSQTTTYYYDGNGRPTKTLLPEGNYTEYAYDVRGNTTHVWTTPKGGGTAIHGYASFDSGCANPKICNKPLTTTDALGKITTYAYDGTHGGVTSVTSPSVLVNGGPASASPQVRYSYGAQYAWYRYPGTAGAIGQGASPIWVQTQSSACQTGSSCIGTSDEVRTTTIYQGGSLSVGTNLLPAIVQRGSGADVIAQSSVGYDIFSNVTVTTDALGRQNFAFYDANRRSIGSISEDPDGGGSAPRRATRIQYNADGQVNAVFEGTATGTALSNLTGMSVLRYAAIDYDGNGRKVKTKLVDGAGTATSSTEYSYDAAGRPLCTAVRMDAGTFGSVPDACAQKSGDANNPDRISATIYNAAGTLSYVQNGLTTGLAQNTVTYYYNGNMTVAAVVDAKSNRTGYEYDGFDRLKKTYYPSPTSPGTSSTTDYEELNYDAGSRVTSVRRRDGQSISYSYDDVNRMTGRYYSPGNNNANALFRYDLLGRMTSAERGNGAFTASMTASYDALGRKLSEASTYNGSTKTVSYSYDAMSQRNGINIDGLYVTYGYNPAGDLTGVFEGGTAPLANFVYDSWGRRTNLNRANYTGTGWGWDSVSRLTCQAQDLVGGGGLACGNPHASPIVLPVASGQDQVTDFAYNPAGQIKSRTAANDAYAWTQAYNVNRSYTSNGLNQYSSITSSGTITPTYDARGNLTSAGSNSYSYSANNELTGANGMRLDYDMFGRLTYSSGSHTRFLYDGTDLVAEYDDSGNLLRRYVHGPGVDEPLVWYEGAGTGDKRWLHADERGSIVAVTGSAGTALATNSYDPWGIPQTTNLGRFQYTGQTWMPELGLYYYKARFYSATLGRFLQADPVGYADGPNWYAYVGNDPVNFSDPSGLTCTGHLTDTGCGGNYVMCIGNCTERVSVEGGNGNPINPGEENKNQPDSNYLKPIDISKVGSIIPDSEGGITVTGSKIFQPIFDLPSVLSGIGSSQNVILASADGIPTPPDGLPGGPYTAKPNSQGNRAGSFQGPKQPSGPRSQAQYVPPESLGGPPGSQGYFKTQIPGQQGFSRFDLNGNPLTPDQAHPNPIGPSRSFFFLGPLGAALCALFCESPAY